jgi:serine/threonine protein kinase
MPCLVMELLNGGSLFDLLHGVPEGTPPLPLNWSLSFLKDVAEAIEYLHSLPMAHRDLKSQNIMMRVIGGDGNVEPVLIGAWSGLGGVCYGFFCPSIIDHPFQKLSPCFVFFCHFCHSSHSPFCFCLVSSPKFLRMLRFWIGQDNRQHEQQSIVVVVGRCGGDGAMDVV